MPREKDAAAAAHRKDQILDAAATLFANHGFYKTTTAMVAAEVGVTQPYVFHFFRTKEQLYLAVLERAKDRLVREFQAVEAPPELLACRMGGAFNALMATHRDEILLCMQSFATPEPPVRDVVRAHFAQIHELVALRFERAGLPDPGGEATRFVSCGLVIALSEVLALPSLGMKG